MCVYRLENHYKNFNPPKEKFVFFFFSEDYASPVIIIMCAMYNTVEDT